MDIGRRTTTIVNELVSNVNKTFETICLKTEKVYSFLIFEGRTRY